MWGIGHPNDPEGHARARFFRTYLHHKLAERYLHQRRESAGPRLVLAAPEGEDGALSLLCFALAAQVRGYRVLLMGAGSPSTACPRRSPVAGPPRWC